MATQTVTYPYAQYDCYKIFFDLEPMVQHKAARMMGYATTLVGHTEGAHPVKVGLKGEYIVYALPAGTANPLKSDDPQFEGATIGRENCSPYPTEPMSDQVEAVLKDNEPAKKRFDQLLEEEAEMKRASDVLERMLRGDFSRPEGDSA
ncbi:hypothetical protein LTR17_010848 [Elasticomyces elasticus]|nr:hypothetical protein LTR17_010848 [Elasticomyces elasticus]